MGSVDFLKYATSKGVRVFYITNRDEKSKQPTIDNLLTEGFPDVSHETVLCNTGDWNKETRRNEVRKNHRIVLVMGDNLNDFNEDFNKKEITQRYEAVEKNKNKWGEEFIVLPNPMYGDFESAIYHFDKKLPMEEKAKLRRAGLRPML